MIKQLDLRTMALAEAASWRNLIPPEPWTAVVDANPGSFARWLTGRLQAGHRNTRGSVVDARKAHQSFRPVPIVGIAERIAFRALTEAILKDEALSTRSQADYRAFVLGPVFHAFKEDGLQKLSSASVEYVVQADIASCYQYIDHGVLLTELENRTGKIEESRLLVELLGEIQGATYGLPQLLDASDKLAEVYMQILERDAVRKIGHVWRFNDDFRIAVNGYGNAQQALESLAAAARPLGLVLNEQKSNITLFSNYVLKLHVGDSGDSDVESNPSEDVDIDPSELAVHMDDYWMVDDDATSKSETATKWLSGISDTSLNLRNARAKDVKNLRRVFNYLAKEQSPDGLPHVEAVFTFVPQLTPRLCDYLVSMHNAGHSVSAVWLTLTAKSGSQNAWQRAWLTYVARACGLVTDEALEWLTAQYLAAPTGLLHAELALTLAKAGGVGFEELDVALRVQPEAMAPWYAMAINHVDATHEQRAAVRGSSKLYELLVTNSSAGSEV